MSIPEWFKVGAKLRFRGCGPMYEVMSIDLEEGSWVASEYGDLQRYTLDEVPEHWGPCPESIVQMLDDPNYKRGTA